MHLSEYELLEALREPFCPVCSLARQAARSYLAGVIGGGVNDPTVREDWRRRGGLCPRHWRDARELESPAFSLAIIAEDLLGSRMNDSAEAPDCPACAVERDAEERYLQSLRQLPLEQVRRVLTEGHGFVCVRHRRRKPEGELASILDERLELILRDLAEFQRKYDYRFTDEPMGSEGDSWLRAIRALGGDV